MHPDYRQPNFYHFNEDSITLVKEALKLNLDAESILDLCAGCGVIGVEYALGAPKCNKVSFLELQAEFIQYIQENSKLLMNQKIEIFQSSISDFSESKKFDLILCNPPYFFSSSARESEDLQRGICRMFKVDTPQVLLDKANRLLKAEGVLVLCFPTESAQWRNAIEESRLSFELLCEKGKISFLKLIKGDVNK